MTQELPKRNQSQYRTVYKNYLVHSVYSKYFGTHFTQPCSTMTMSTIEGVNKMPILDRAAYSGYAFPEKYKSGLKLVFKHEQDEYKEITNKRAYTVETLLGQVGGFVGKS